MQNRTKIPIAIRFATNHLGVSARNKITPDDFIRAASDAESSAEAQSAIQIFFKRSRSRRNRRSGDLRCNDLFAPLSNRKAVALSPSSESRFTLSNLPLEQRPTQQPGTSFSKSSSSARPRFSAQLVIQPTTTKLDIGRWHGPRSSDSSPTKRRRRPICSNTTPQSFYTNRKPWIKSY